MGETENPRGLKATQKLVWDVLSQRRNNTQANLQAHYEQGLKEKDTIHFFFIYQTVKSPLLSRTVSTSDFFIIVPEDLASKMANLKGTDQQTQGNSPITLIRGGPCNSLTLETTNQLPFFKASEDSIILCK